MKKKLILIMALILCLSLAACSNTEKKTAESKDSKTKSNLDKEYVVGKAIFPIDPKWEKEKNGDSIDLSNGHELTSIYAEFYKNGDSIEKRVETTSEYLKEGGLTVDSKEEAEIDGHKAIKLEYHLIKQVTGVEYYVKSGNDQYYFAFVEYGDGSMSRNEFDSLVENIKIYD